MSQTETQIQIAEALEYLKTAGGLAPSVESQDSDIDIEQIRGIIDALALKYDALQTKYTKTVRELDTCQHAYTAGIHDLKHLAQDFVTHLQNHLKYAKVNTRKNTAVKKTLVADAYKNQSRYRKLRMCIYLSLIVIIIVFASINARYVYK